MCRLAEQQCVDAQRVQHSLELHPCLGSLDRGHTCGRGEVVHAQTPVWLVPASECHRRLTRDRGCLQQLGLPRPRKSHQHGTNEPV